ncbi:DUF2489 domain-containing protein [Porticoccaceae bacterium LTM1]|nr:DUF2489 domain-containing protein [Porticoccaceae bacterium LTM1]
MLIWISLAVLIITGLGFYAWHLHQKVKTRIAEQEASRKEVEAFVKERSDNITNSIVVIAGAMLEEQMSLSECCIRLSSLLNQLGPVGQQDRFLSLHKAAEELGHIPILDEWKQLKFKQQMTYLKEMEIIEDKYGDFILETCRTIHLNGLNLPKQEEKDGGVGFYQP